MNTQSNAVAHAAPIIPVLSQLETLPTFGAFKVEERISFVRPYDPRVTALTNFRHAVLRYRNTDGKTVKQAQMVTVPQIKLPEEYTLLPEKAVKVLMGVFEDEQDAMIRSMIDTGASTIGWDLITLDHILESLTAVRISQRLTKEQIEAWFKIACKDVCTTRAVQIAEAKNMSSEDRTKQIAGTINAYSNLACKLAAPVPNIGENEARALKNLLAVGKLDDDMAKVLLTKLEQILNPKVVENTDL